MSIIRDLTVLLQKHLFESEILLIIGARQVGKTTVLRQIENRGQRIEVVCSVGVARPREIDADE